MEYLVEDILNGKLDPSNWKLTFGYHFITVECTLETLTEWEQLASAEMFYEIYGVPTKDDFVDVVNALGVKAFH